MKTELIVVKTTKEFKQKVKKYALVDNQNMSEYITSCVLKDFKEKVKNETTNVR